MGNSLLDIIVFGRNAGKAAAAKAKNVELGNMNLDHIQAYAEELKLAGINTGDVSPLLLPKYARTREIGKEEGLFIVNWFQESVLGNTLMIVFLVAFLGYLVGSIKIRGVELGTAGVLLVALVFGHFGFEVPDLVRELGLICFVTSVGFIAGPEIFPKL